MSAFAPIANPINSVWGKKAFEGYLGDENKEEWAEYDATELVKKWKGEPLDILIDVVSHRLLYYTKYLSDTALCRVQQIISTMMANSFLRILSKPLKERERSMSGGRMAMIIVTLQWRLLRMITLITLQSISWQKGELAWAYKFIKRKEIVLLRYVYTYTSTKL